MFSFQDCNFQKDTLNNDKTDLTTYRVAALLEINLKLKTCSKNYPQCPHPKVKPILELEKEIAKTS